MIHSLSNDTAFVFMTNKIDPMVMDRFREIYSHTNNLTTWYVLIDAKTADIEREWLSYLRNNSLESVALTSFRIAEVAAELSVNLFAPGRLIPGSAHLPLLWLSRKLTHKFYWFIEDDVVFTGNLGDLVKKFDSDDSALLCSHLASFGEIPKWPWWSTLKAPAEALRGSDPLKLVAKGFFPAYRISAKALFKILDYQRAGWAGHFEVLIPTILRYSGLPVGDLNVHNAPPVYSSGALRPGEGLGSLSSLRFRPAISMQEIQRFDRPLLFHPVKSLSSEQ
jgi:hypothetical protein